MSIWIEHDILIFTIK